MCEGVCIYIARKKISDKVPPEVKSRLNDHTVSGTTWPCSVFTLKKIIIDLIVLQYLQEVLVLARPSHSNSMPVSCYVNIVIWHNIRVDVYI